MSVSSSVVVSGSGNSKVFYSGDSGYDVDVTGRASLYVSGGAYVSGVTVRTSSYLYISSGGTVSSLMLSAGTGRIFSGGKLAGGELSGRTMLVVSSGGTAAGLSVTSNGNVNVDVYANDSATVISGSNVRGMFSLSNGVASNFILYSRGAQAVYSGALTSDITVGRSGNLYVSSGGTALGVVQEEGGLVYAAVYGGDTKTVVRGSNAAGAFYLSGGIADNFIITNGGMQNVYSGGVARRTLASGMQAMITVYSGGAISGATVAANASLILNGNTVADGVSVLSGGSMEARLGALVSGVSVWGNAYFTSAMVGGDEASSQKSSEISGMYVGRTGVVSIVKNVVLKDTVTIAGSLTVADGAAVSAYQGGAINFDISGSSAGNAALVDGLSRISGEAGYTLTVSDKQKNGKFILASGAAGFNRTITVKTDKGAGVGELNVGGTLNYGEHYTYSLANENGALALTVGVTGILPPAAPTAKADITSATNRNVTVTAVFGDDAEIKEYSLDGSTWRNYDSGVVMDSNGTVYFRGLNYLDMVSDVTQYAVTNIDRVAPAAPTVKASTTALTNKNVTVTATFSADSAQKQYSTDNKTWKSYTAALSVGANGVFYFRGIDAAGNVSKVASIKVANIDKSAPDAPTAAANTTAPTKNNVIVTAAFGRDSAKKQYSTDNRNWKNYSKPITVKANGTYSFRGISAAGNISPVTTIRVDNIDKVAPTAPTVAVSTTALTNRSVSLTAKFSNDSVKKQYSSDKKTWKNYTGVLSVNANGTYYFRGIDAAGNISKVTNIKIKNIDKVAPSAPTFKLSSSKPTNSLTVTAKFSKDSAVKEYSTDGAKWKPYTDKLLVKANGTYYFRGTDAAGNVSGVAAARITNIDNVAPAAPTVRADTTAPTNKKVTLTAAFSSDTVKKQYSMDNRSWKNCSKPVAAGKNGTYYFRGIDAAGNISKVVSIKVDNIDTAAPNAPTVTASTAAPTNRNVMLTAKFSNDSVKKQYSSDKKTWKNYTGALAVNANGTYYFRGIDAAGNISKVASIKVGNIDKVAPAAPTVKLSTAKPAAVLTVTAKFSKDSSRKEYSTDGKKWQSCTGKLTVKANGTYYFRGIDAAGNVSKVASVKVANIADTANNSWDSASELTGTVSGVLDRVVDPVDYYEVGDVAKLMMDMESGKAKVTFCGSDKKAVPTEVKCADGSVRTLSAVELTAGDRVNDNITLSDLNDAVRYLKIESAASGAANYRLAKLA